MVKALYDRAAASSLPARIVVALVLGVAVGALLPQIGKPIGQLGALFVNSLKAIAPLLVFLSWPPRSRHARRAGRPARGP